MHHTVAGGGKIAATLFLLKPAEKPPQGGFVVLQPRGQPAFDWSRAITGGELRLGAEPGNQPLQEALAKAGPAEEGEFDAGGASVENQDFSGHRGAVRVMTASFSGGLARALGN
jgi:hypothetical protein